MTDKVGNVIRDIKFSDEEESRLRAKILDTASLQYKILVEKTPLLESQGLWKSAIKIFRVPGFRHSSLAIRPIILNKVLSNFGYEFKSRESELSWKIYRLCVIRYVVDELSNLNELLLKEDLNVIEDKVTENVFELIIKNATSYGVSNENIRQLYDIWGFSRISNFEQLLANENISNETLQKAIVLHDNKIKEIVAQLQDIKKIKSSAVIEALSDMQAIKKELTSIRSYLKFEISKNVNNLVIEQTNPVVGKVNDFAANMKTIRSNVNSLQDKVDSNVLVAITSLQDRIYKVEKYISSIKEESIHGRHNASESENRKYYIKDILSIWKNIWCSFGVPKLSNGGILFLIFILKAGNLFVVKRADIILSLLRKLPGVEMREISASPSWFYEDDWEKDIQFVEQNSSRPRVLIIHNFDAAVQESYLLPFLIRWFYSESSHDTKIFLIPSESNTAQICKKVFEMAIMLDFDSTFINMITTQGRVIDTKVNIADISKENMANILFADQDVKERNTHEKELKVITSAEYHPTYLISNFVNIEQSLTSIGDAYTHSNDALYIAAWLTIFPWGAESKGDIDRKLYEGRLKSIFGVSDENIF